MEKIGLFIEFKDGGIKPAVFGMITGARGEGGDLSALVVNRDPADCEKELGEYGVDRIIGITAAGGGWHPDLWADALVQAMAAFGIQTLLGVTSPQGRDILPRVAAQLDAPLLMDCLEVDLETHVARTTRYSGKTVAAVRLTGTQRIYGVRANAVPAAPSPSEPSVETFTPAETELPDLTVLETTPGRGDAVDLAEADVILSGGRGMKNGENFKILFDCARTMNAAVGSSRVAVDEGWVPYAMQVGQTGTKVNPKVYIACGISGSIQHFAGMKSSDIIIAINADPNAAIISKSDYYAVMDLFEVVPRLTKRLEEDRR